MAGEVQLFSLLWIWLIMAPIYVTVDILLRSVIIPWLLGLYRRSSYYQKLVKREEMVEKGLPGHTSAVMAER